MIIVIAFPLAQGVGIFLINKLSQIKKWSKDKPSKYKQTIYRAFMNIAVYHIQRTPMLSRAILTIHY